MLNPEYESEQNLILQCLFDLENFTNQNIWKCLLKGYTLKVVIKFLEAWFKQAWSNCEKMYENNKRVRVCQ